MSEAGDNNRAPVSRFVEAHHEGGVESLGELLATEPYPALARRPPRKLQVETLWWSA